MKDDIVRITKKYSAFRNKPIVDPELFKVMDTRESAIAVQSISNPKSVFIRNCYLVNFVSRPNKSSHQAKEVAEHIVTIPLVAQAIPGTNAIQQNKFGQAFREIVKVLKKNPIQVSKQIVNNTNNCISNSSLLSLAWIPSPPPLPPLFGQANNFVAGEEEAVVDEFEEELVVPVGNTVKEAVKNLVRNLTNDDEGEEDMEVRV